MDKVEAEINKQAEILGDLNMELNKYIESNQGISLQIVQLQDRIHKKKKLVEQEDKDKSIIHQKLIKAEQRIEELKAKVLILEAESVKMNDVEVKIEKTVIENEIKRPEFLNKQPKSENKEVNQQINNLNYDNASKGDYEPPSLFLDGANDDDDSDVEDNDDVLESVRQKLENLGDEEEEDEEEENEEEDKEGLQK